MSRFVITLLAGCFAAGMPIAAQAQTAEDDSGLRTNCVGDYFRFCAATMPGTPAIRQCFARNFNQLTPACAGAIRAFDRRVPRR